MKHNTFKRTLAAGLAVLCAAAYAPIFGNTGLFDIAITVSAAPPGLTQHTLTLYANNGTDESWTTSETAGVIPISLPANFTTPDNMQFSHWNTAADGTGDDYASGSLYYYRSDLTLYAQWVTPVTVVSLNKDTLELIKGTEETLVATITPDNATYQTLTWTSSDPSVATVDANGKVTAIKSGTATITATATNGTEDTYDDESASCEVTVTYEDGIGERLEGYSLSLDGDIGVNFYMELDDSIIAHGDTAYMEFTIPKGSDTETKTILVKDATKKQLDGKTYYVFKCNVSAKDMASDIKAQIIDGDNKGEQYTYSVKDYADYLLLHTADDATYAKAAPLVKKLLNYGAASQTYFGIAGTAVNADLNDADKVIDNVPIPEKFMYNEANTHLPTGVTLAGATLSLKSETTLSLYFTGLPDNTEFTCGDKEVKTEKNGNYVVARIRGIKAEELENNFILTFNDNSNSVTYNPMTYCYNVLNGGTTNDALKNVCKALYQYAEAAKPNS